MAVSRLHNHTHTVGELHEREAIFTKKKNSLKALIQNEIKAKIHGYIDNDEEEKTKPNTGAKDDKRLR